MEEKYLRSLKITKDRSGNLKKKYH